jgi:hypothetical protein
LAWTSSMMARQRALKAPAGMVLVFMVLQDHGHFIMVMSGTL